ncbi:MAG: methyltransferase domain-containing protein, partial [Pseudomonadota bacterium]
NDEWQEIRLDIDADAKPDIVGTMLDMSAVDDASMDAIYSSHNIEHVYAHQVPIMLGEFKRVLKPDGFLVVTCPDLQSVCALVAEGKLLETAYESPAGPISPLDILYGHRASLAGGNEYMAHKCGFTEEVLRAILPQYGFARAGTVSRPHPYYDLWAVATVADVTYDALRTLATQHFP